jgi:hypothetical protein
LGVDNLAKWQKNMQQLKRFGRFFGHKSTDSYCINHTKICHFSSPQESGLEPKMHKDAQATENIK